MTFYKETEFQITTDGKIPKEWENPKVAEVGYSLIGGGTTKSACKQVLERKYSIDDKRTHQRNKYCYKGQKKNH